MMLVLLLKMRESQEKGKVRVSGERRRRKEKETSARMLGVFLNTQKGRDFNEILKIPLLQIKGYYNFTCLGFES